jgi:hypothetical protein
MTLKRNDNKTFDSIYFEELFARYQDRLVKESLGSHLIDYPDEVYSFLICAFSKIVSQFARENNLSEKSDKWFSSFFWRSIQNKIADLQKTNNYAKRTPLIICEVCGKQVGQINKKHLLQDGHEEIIDDILYKVGRDMLFENSNSYCENDENYFEFCLNLGKEKFNKMSEKEQKELLESECVNSYLSLYPNSYLRNKIMSINEKVGDEDDTELIDFSTESVYYKQPDFIENLELEDKINGLIDIMMADKDLFNDYFETGISNEKKHSIMHDILMKKVMYYNSDEMSDDIVDESVLGVKSGFTNYMLEYMKSSDSCRMFIRNELKPEKEVCLK